ncbi:MAG: glycerophosphodiester phosphodiesterase [Chitinophagaceae bacterium]|nr:glycerophosphodiester phosphodiesterase [Chitinophagaceae bacterium]
MTRIISVVIFFLFACKTTFVHTNNKQPVFDYQGHRGCRGLMPENTIPAMLKAIDLGVTTLETDVVITKDRKPILSHEPIFNHEIATKPNGDPVTEQEEQSLNIYQMDYNVVRTYDVGLKPHPRFAQQQKIAVSKPLLADMIDAAEAYASKQQKALPHYNMETKSDPKTDNTHHPLPAEFVELIMQVVLNKKIEKRTTIQSFDPRTLQYLHKHYPNMQTALLIEDFDKRSLAQQLKELGFSPTIYSPHYSLVTTELLALCKARKIKVIPWTVNDLPTMQRLKDMGVDGLISDFPNLYKGIGNRE